ncbi:MAG: SCO6880 family protein [Propionicimonas sp.]|nr:SCO6880 family protein [Propionicimonas sp.]MEA5116211.1 SCO6880 family protein [Propionicimonas sp.]
MATVYSDYGRDRTGWFFGLSGAQLAALTIGGAPALWAFNAEQWGPLLGLVAGWVLMAVLVVVPIRGRSATGWLAASAAHAIGALFRWTTWRSHAARGQADDLGVPDLPGVLHGFRVHDAPPQGPAMTRVAVIQDKANRVWAVTAAITHPGLALADADERTRQGRGLTDLLNACARTELISEVIFVVRSVPDDGAERDQWLVRHLRPDAPALARQVNGQLAQVLSQAALRTEAFVTIVAPEVRLAKEAREFGRGVDARARAMLMLAGEVEAQLRAGMRVTEVEWLTSPKLAVAVRTGFAPGDRAGIIEALAARDTDPAVNADVPWAQAGPSGADAVVRHYSHDAWNSISATIKLPARGAVIGALAPVLVPTEPGERRSLMAAFPILAASAADRQTANAEWAADMGESLRAKAGVKTRARDQQATDRTRGLDAKLASGHALVRPYAVATVTVPKTARIAEHGRRLDAAIRRAGFAPLRLDLAQDAGFAASTVPLGMSLTRKVEGA